MYVPKKQLYIHNNQESTNKLKYCTICKYYEINCIDKKIKCICSKKILEKKSKAILLNLLNIHKNYYFFNDSIIYISKNNNIISDNQLYCDANDNIGGIYKCNDIRSIIRYSYLYDFNNGDLVVEPLVDTCNFTYMDNLQYNKETKNKNIVKDDKDTEQISEKFGLNKYDNTSNTKNMFQSNIYSIYKKFNYIYIEFM